VGAAVADHVVPGPKSGLMEFIVVDGHRIFGFCGGCAAAHARAISEQVMITNALQVEVYHEFRALKNAKGEPLMDASGVTTCGGIVAYLRSRGIPLIEYHLWTGEVPLRAAYTAIQKYAGVYPMVVQTAQGQHMVDEITGAKMNAALDKPLSHFLVVEGRHEGGVSDFAVKTFGYTKELPAGCWMADGDSMIVRRADEATHGGRLVFYSDKSLAAAQLDSYIVVGYKAKVTTLPAPTPAPTQPPVHVVSAAPHPSATTALTLDEAGALYAQYFDVIADPQNAAAKCLALKTDHKVVIRGGLLDGYLSEPSRYGYAGLESFGLPLSNEATWPGAKDAWVQWFELGGLADDPNGRIDRRPGQAGPYYRVHLDRMAADVQGHLFPASQPAGVVETPEEAALVQAAERLADAEATAGLPAAEQAFTTAANAERPKRRARAKTTAAQ
jgi:hypothetical protein